MLDFEIAFLNIKIWNLSIFFVNFLNFYSAKDEGLGACAQTRVRRRIFSLFPMMVGLKSWCPTTKSTFCFLSLIRCLVKFVVLESHSQSLWVLNQYHITINTHLLSHIATFCLSLYFFCPNKICLIVAFTFILLTCNNTIRSVLLKARKNNWDTKHFFHKEKELPICPINKQKANSLTVFNISFERMNFASTSL